MFKRTNTASSSKLEDMEYIKTKVEPILGEMMVKIVNENPSNALDFMLEYLKERARREQTNSWSILLF